MSAFSDKSDFADLCEMHYSPDRIAEAHIYVNDVPLKVRSPKDLIPYYGNITGSYSSSKDGPMSIHLSSYSQPDRMERDTIDLFLSEFVHRAKKAKRKHETLTFKDFEYPANPIERWAMFNRAMDNRDFLIKHYTPYMYTKTYDPDYSGLNESILDTMFRDIHTGFSDRYRRNLLEHAAPYFGSPYKIFDHDEWKEVMEFNRNRIEYEPCPALFRIQEKVWEYNKMSQTFAKEQMK